VIRDERLETLLPAVDTRGYTDVAMAIAKLLGFDLCAIESTDGSTPLTGIEFDRCAPDRAILIKCIIKIGIDCQMAHLVDSLPTDSYRGNSRGEWKYWVTSIALTSNGLGGRVWPSLLRLTDREEQIGLVCLGSRVGHFSAPERHCEPYSQANCADKDHDARNCNHESLSDIIVCRAGSILRDAVVAAGHLKYMAAVGAWRGHAPNPGRAAFPYTGNCRGVVCGRYGVRALIDR